ncbi:MAG: helix-hairpin-helix domain-containing protein, partial [Thermoplasmata archaeon]
MAFVALLGLLFLTTNLQTVLGEHTPSHRYFVSGYVSQEDGSPACGVVIQANERTSATDYRGWYRIQLHMHDETVSGSDNDVGETIEVRVVGTAITKTTTAIHSQIDDGWGESRVDFEIPTGLSEACINPLVQAALYVGIPAVAVVGLSLVYFKLVRPRWLLRSVAPSLSSLPGIGRGRLRELGRMGIENLEDLAGADPSEIARQTSIGKKEAKRLVRRAREKLA